MSCAGSAALICAAVCRRSAVRRALQHCAHTRAADACFHRQAKTVQYAGDAASRTRFKKAGLRVRGNIVRKVQQRFPPRINGGL